MERLLKLVSQNSFVLFSFETPQNSFVLLERMANFAHCHTEPSSEAVAFLGRDGRQATHRQTHIKGYERRQGQHHPPSRMSGSLLSGAIPGAAGVAGWHRE